MVPFKESLKSKILIPFLVIALTFFIVTQILVHLFLVGTLSTQIDQQLRSNTSMLHQIIEASYQKSVHNYLRGITDQNLRIIRSFHQSYQKGEITREQWMIAVRRILHAQKIGKDGYPYVLDSNGSIIIHPDESLVGSDSIFAEEIRSRLEYPDEYVEYIFKDRWKVLYRSYIPELDWILSATAYKDDFHYLLDLSSLEFPVQDGWDIGFLLDRSGNLLLSGKHESGGLPQSVIDSLVLSANSSSQGILDKEWQGEPYRIYYKVLDDFQWIIGTAVSLTHVYSPVKKLSAMLAGLNILTLGMILLLLILLLRKILLRLNRFTLKIMGEEGTELKDLKNLGDEISLLENVFGLFIQRLHYEEMRVAEANEENRQLARFPSELQFPLIRVDQAGYILFMNSAAREISIQITEMGQERISRPLFESLLQRDKSDDALHILLKTVPYKVYLTPLQESDELYLHFHDRTMELQLETMTNRWLSVFETSSEGIVVTDGDGMIEQVNTSFSLITGYSKEEIVGKSISTLRSYRQDRHFYKEMWESLIKEGRWLGEIWNRTHEGDINQQWLSISSFSDRQNDQIKYMGIFHDITDLRKKEEELDHIIHYDPLTDLPNRNSFFGEFSALLDCSGEKDNLALIILDVDNYVMLYNSLGTELGDLYLREVSQLFQDVLRAEDILARLSTSEFAILMADSKDKESCHQLIQRLLVKLDRNLPLGDHQISPLVNMGVSFFPQDGKTPELLIRRSRAAMQKARATRRGSCQYFEAQMDKKQLDQFDLEVDLKSALRNREFQVEYQPKGSLHNDGVFGFEALLRWKRQGEIRVSPSEFIPLLEESGAIIETGSWIIGEVCRFINEVRAYSSKSFRIAVNISARQLADSDFLDTLKNICKDHGVPSTYIELEITENMATLELEGILVLLQQIRKEGFTISIDDFGTGYSSLAYLQDIPFDSIKIDRCFISSITEKKNSLAIVRSIVAIAQSMNKQTIAEGVENEEQKEICRKEGCDHIQGFQLSPPMIREKALDFFLKKNPESIE